jgi:transposase-like protein
MKRPSSPFKWRHYAPDVILLCVRWYCRYSLSYRDLEEMMRERGLAVDHVTIFRWVQRLRAGDQQEDAAAPEDERHVLPPR